MCNVRSIKVGLLLLLIMLTACSKYSKQEYISTYKAVDSSDWGLEMTEITIEIPGVEYEKTYLFMTDNQANFDATHTDLGWFGSSENRVFKDKNGISSAENMDNWINYANDSMVDAVLIGGDIIDFYSDENISVLQKYLNQLSVPYIYTYGNHDSYVPWENKFYDDEEEFVELFENGSHEISVLDVGEYYIVSVRNYAIDGTASVSEKAVSEFERVCEEGKPIILICHVPIYTEYTNGRRLWV